MIPPRVDELTEETAPVDAPVTSAPGTWAPDALLDGFECRTLPLAATPEAEEPDAPLVGTLVRRADPARRTGRPAWLYVHGWNDYFFQTHLADAVEELGFAFHAVDLRRYGRSYVAGQFFGYVADLAEYAEELDAACAVLREDHDEIVLMGHSTGGLTASLYAADRPGALIGLVLNSPWLDLHGPPALAAVLRPLLQQWGRRRATSPVPLREEEESVYAQVTHASHGGEWSYELGLKSDAARPVRVGWLRAILAGHQRVAQGLGIGCPVFVATSARTVFLRHLTDAARSADTVLDVDRIGAAATRLGRHLTLVRIEGGVHDLLLSPAGVRAALLGELGRWVRAYVGVATA